MTQKNGMRAAEVDRQALEAVADMLDDWHAEGGDPPRYFGSHGANAGGRFGRRAPGNQKGGPLMAAVIAHFSLPVAWQNAHAMKKAFIRWSHTCKAFGVRDLCLIDVDDLSPHFGDAQIRTRVVADLPSALAEFPSHKPVFVEQGGAPLEKYKFPENPVFVYGDDFAMLQKADVEIKSALPLNAEMANAIVLNHWRQSRAL